MQRKSEDPINQVTRAAHRQQFLWHILMPIILGALLFVILGVLATISQGNKPAVWANISLIFIVTILMFTGIGSAIVLALGIVGVDWMTRKIPPLAFLAQVYIQYFGRKVSNLADSSTKPVVEVRSIWASLKPVFRRLSRVLRK